MGRKTKQIGGFAALNTGIIKDSYSAVKVKAKGAAAGFCAQNQGTLTRCLFRGRIANGKHPRAGLCLRQEGSMTNCLWVRWEKDSKEDRYPDWPLSITKQDLQDEEETPELLQPWLDAPDWVRITRKGILDLVTKESLFQDSETDNAEEITCPEDLEDLAIAVYEGRVKPGTRYRLTGDIDMRGANWTPIGSDPHMPFEGFLDGNGHSIFNFRVKASKHPYAGLFGCIGKHGHIQNLTVDCVLTGEGSSAGPICGRNEGTILQCVARSKASLSRYTGGFVGQNEGFIANCCAHGHAALPFIIPWWLPGAGVLLAAAIISLGFYLNTQADPGPEIFAPVIIDPNAKPLPDDIPEPDPDELSTTNATFIMNAEMSVSTANYAGIIGLRSPSWSTRGFVATVRATKADLAAHGIQVTEEYTTLYQSGLICPGYGVDVITLGTLPDGTALPPGEYEFSVRFEFYNIANNEKSPVDAVVPLDVTIH